MTKRKTAAVVLAAGLGTRMKSDRPKVLHLLAGRPMIGHVLETLAALRLDPIAVVIGPHMDEVVAAASPHPCVVQRRPLGTADAVKAARPALIGFTGDLLVAFADTPLVRAPTLARLLEARARPPHPAVVVLGMRLAEPGHYGRLVVGPEGELEAIVEYRDATPEQRAITFCNSGLLAADAATLLDLLEEVGNDNAKGEYYLTDVVRVARARGLACAAVEGPADELIGVNSRAELATAEAKLQERLRAAAMENGATLIDPASVHFSFDTALARDVIVGPHVVFGPGVSVEKGAEIRAFCHIEGAQIGRGATIGPFARLRPGSRVDEKAHVGNFVEMKNAVLGPGAKANHLSYIGDASVGEGANIGAGTITCNYDGFRKARTEIGRDAFIGSNTALVAPVRVGAGAVVGAGSVITRDVPANALALARGEQTNVAQGAARLRARKGEGAKGPGKAIRKAAKAAKTAKKRAPAGRKRARRPKR